MSTKVVPATENCGMGLAQFSISIPKGNAIIIRRADGSSVVFKDDAAECVIAPILSFTSSFNLGGAAIPYRCEILPKVVPGMGDKKFPREISPELRKKVQQKLDTNGTRLIKEQFYERMITIEVSHDNLDFTCLIKLTDHR